jgi:hypothetical protein
MDVNISSIQILYVDSSGTKIKESNSELLDTFGEVSDRVRTGFTALTLVRVLSTRT